MPTNSVPGPAPVAGDSQPNLDNYVWTNEALQTYMNRLLFGLEKSLEPEERSLHQRTLQKGLQVLLGHHMVPDTQPWRDLKDYSRAVILCPTDDKSRAGSLWTRSTSGISQELLSRYGPDTVQAAKDGLVSLIMKNFDGKKDRIPQIDKKANFLRNFEKQAPGKAYYPENSPLSIITYETGNVACSLALLAWTSIDDAVIYGMLTHHAICDDYHKFSQAEFELRVRLVAMGVGAAYSLGEHGPAAVLDGSLLQAQGNGTDKSIHSTMAWRAISGCSTPYNGSHFGPTSQDEAVAPPMMMMAVHDMLDWRSDTAAGNHENAVTSTYGLGF